MNLHETVFSIFPGCTLTSAEAGDGMIEVGGIASGAVPQNCQVLASGVFQYSSQERSRRSYLVKANELLLMVRLIPGGTNRLSAQIMTKPATADRSGSRQLH